MFRAYRVLVLVPAILAILNVVLAIAAVAEGPCIPTQNGGC